MSADIIVGLQWGDEGKGKIVDLLSRDYDIVVRYQGGANAGHTVVFNSKKYVLHLIPSGIFTDKIICIIGNGTVIDPDALADELNYLSENGFDVTGRLIISTDAHVILPYHKLIDSYSESGDNKLGTTKKGIGPAYIDKYSRCGIKIADLFNENILTEKLKINIEEKKKRYPSIDELQSLDAETIKTGLLNVFEKIKPFIQNTQMFLSKSLKENKRVLLEGAQGCLLDIDFGTYPYVTSSHPTSGGASVGSGIPPNKIKNVIGISKAYTTRVGEGPFPTELLNGTGEMIRNIGHEYGSTTSRPRRCGWLDMVALKYACIINGVTELALTKIDVLNDFEEINVCTAYTSNGEEITDFQSNPYILANVKPVYKTFKGWKDVDSSNKSELDVKLREYISFIEDYIDVKVKYLSVGSDRNETIIYS